VVRRAFDTLALARSLRERAGFSPEHAEEAAQAIAESMVGEVAVRADLVELGTTLRGEIGALRVELKTDMAELRAELKTDMAELRAELKAEMADLKTELKTDMADLRAELKTDIGGVKADLTRLMLTVATGQVALLLAAMFSLARLGH